MFISLRGKVKQGRKQGRKLGFRTINISVPRTVKKKQWGVYFSLVKIKDRIHPAITHLGPLITFSLTKPTCETHLLKLKERLYGRNVEVKLILKLRDVEQFPNIKDLKKQIRRDVKAAKKFFGL